MRILISPDSFKGSLTASEAADAIASGVRRVLPDAELTLVPLADGGEGTVEAMVRSTGGRIVRTPATDPLGHTIDSFFGILGDGSTAVVEMAAASGLTLVPEHLRNPMVTTTYGTGELIRAALDTGCRRLILGIGGSATCDGGVGAIQALGGCFRDGSGAEVGYGGGELIRIRSVDISRLDPRLAATEVLVACDVDNPLTGQSGAAAVFGPQKGATPDMIRTLDAGLRNLARVIREYIGVDVENAPGAGAAGGMGAAALAFLHAELKPGIAIVMEATRFADRVRDVDLVITGEGRIDFQTLRGKTVAGVLAEARKAGVPVLALGGTVEPEGYELLEHGAVGVIQVTPQSMTREKAYALARELVGNTVAEYLESYRRPG